MGMVGKLETFIQRGNAIDLAVVVLLTRIRDLLARR